ncbi:MAG: hypothetical protein JKY46_10585 [Robiginitomaculum sp.]|nr:hypothetical protein [Robiginitomaculum sp.]
MQSIMPFTDNFRDFASKSQWVDSLNIDSLNKVYLSADIDWAPDYAVEVMLAEIEKRNLKMTVFATHKSSLLLQPQPNIEIGVHPDYTRTVEQKDLKYQLSFLLDIFPDALGVRSHRNFFGQNTCDFANEFQLKYEASNIQWGMPFLCPHRDYNQMVRIPYFWEDGIHCDMNLPWTLDQLPIHCAGLKVINFHPMALYLNSPTESHRRSVVGNYSDLTIAPFSVLEKQRFHGTGAFTYFKMILDMLVEQRVNCDLMSELI